MNFKFKNKNIVFLLGSPELGGAERQALTLAGFLQNKLNCKVTVYSCINRKPSSMFSKMLELHQLRDFHTIKNPLVASGRFKSLKIKLSLFLFALKLRAGAPDVIIPYLNKQSIIAALCLKVSGASITFWNNRGHEIYRNDTLEKKAVKLTDLFLVNGLDSIADITRNLGVAREQVYFLPNFLTLNKTAQNNLIRSDNESLVIGMLAHFRPGKLHFLLLKSFLELSHKYPNITLKLAGSVDEGSNYKSLKSFIIDNNLNDKVSIISNVSGEDIIPTFDIAVLVSEKEGMSNSVMEYMFFQKPIVCTRLSSNEYLLGDDSSFLVLNEQAELVERLLHLILNKELRIQEGLKNHNRIVHNFNIEKYITSLEKVVNRRS